jgi:hypothetical protein
MSVIVNDLNLVGVALSPPETHAPLIVDPNAMLASPIAVQPLQSVAWRDAEIAEALGGVQRHELPQHDALEVSRKSSHALAREEALGIAVGKGRDHRE